VIAGENRDCVGVLAWLNPAGCRRLVGDATPDTLADLALHAAVREHVRAALAHWNASQTGGSQRIGRMLLLPDSPSIDANEITDKGYINQRLALERRRSEVERLFAAEPDGDVMVL
jgi:feruloyl-CoA synthase